MNHTERSVIGETVDILRAMGGDFAFKDLGKDAKLLLLDQARRLEDLLTEDINGNSYELSAKEQFLINH